MDEKSKTLLQNIRIKTVHETVLNNQYITHKPTDKQFEFLFYPDILEGFYGGAAGGGKSDALLMAALQFAEVPRYSALLLRRTYADLSLPEALMDRAQEWLSSTDARWHADTKTWEFPSGATLTFGYLQTERDKYRYQGAAFQMVGFDEITQFTESMYQYLFSRLRRLEDSHVPIRMRAASNPGDIGHCVPYGRVLTVTGWQDIEEIKLGDMIYTVRENGDMAIASVEQTYKERYVGDMVSIRARGLSITCTPNHRIAKLGGTKRDKNKLFSLVPFEHLPGHTQLFRSVGWVGKAINEFTLPKWYVGRKLKNEQPRHLSGVDYAALVGWMLSEGCVIDRDKAISIAQSKDVSKDVIDALLQKCGFKYAYNGHQFTIYSPDWWHYFSQFEKCRSKYIPAELKNSNIEELTALFEALVAGDGHWVKPHQSGQYYTTSKQLCDDVLEVALKLGYIISYSARQRPDRVGLSYCINFERDKIRGTHILTGHHSYNVKTTTKRRTDIKTVYYDGFVYCIGVPDTHNFIIEQDGCVWVSGNSWVKRRWIVPTPAELREMKRFFVPAFLEDNPYLDIASYDDALNKLDPITREQLRHGDWDISISGGMFERTWFEIADTVPRGRQVRFWDLAATEAKKGSDPDWTVGVLMVEAGGMTHQADSSDGRHRDANIHGAGAGIIWERGDCHVREVTRRICVLWHPKQRQQDSSSAAL